MYPSPLSSTLLSAEHLEGVTPLSLVDLQFMEPILEHETKFLKVKKFDE